MTKPIPDWVQSVPGMREAAERVHEIDPFQTPETVLASFKTDIARAEAQKADSQAEAQYEIRKTTELELERDKVKLERERLKTGLSSNDCNWAPRELLGRKMSAVTVRAIDYLWSGWLPKKYITLVVGETGASKTTVMADVVARETTGTPWPGETEHRRPGRVLWLGSEDGAEDMTVPRLRACGANLERVIEIQGVLQNGKRTTFSMQDDIDGIRRWLAHACDAERDPFTLLVIDPITSYLPGRKLRKVDLNDSGQFRSIIEPWFEVAQTFNIAIATITHFNKDTTRSMLHRVTGTAAFAQTCRSLMAFVESPSDDHVYAKALLQIKTNLPDHPGAGWRFHTEKVQIDSDPDNHKPINATRPVWDMLDPDLTPESLIGGERGPLSDFAQAFGPWLRNHFASLGNNPLPVSGVLKAAIEANAASKNWWQQHSSRFLQKRNIDGRWMCLPK